MRPVHAVVVAFHAPEALGRCLTALCRSVEVTVVDNSSSQEVERVAARHGVRYLDPEQNLGFAGGVNVALRSILETEPCDALLVNPDAELDHDAIEKLAASLHDSTATRRGSVAPRLVAVEGLEQRVLWPYPSPFRAWLEAIGLGRFSGRARFAVGAVLLLRWEALQEVGLFDERFFLYAEEADWQRRALDHGWTTGLCADAVAVHAGAGTSADESRREVLFHAGQEIYVRKWFGTTGWWNYRAAVVCGAAARALVLPAERRREAARRALLYTRGPRRLAGRLHRPA
jgi:GT2 family glycosyltransferase